MRAKMRALITCVFHEHRPAHLHANFDLLEEGLVRRSEHKKVAAAAAAAAVAAAAAHVAYPPVGLALRIDQQRPRPCTERIIRGLGFQVTCR